MKKKMLFVLAISTIAVSLTINVSLSKKTQNSQFSLSEISLVAQAQAENGTGGTDCYWSNSVGGCICSNYLLDCVCIGSRTCSVSQGGMTCD